MVESAGGGVGGRHQGEFVEREPPDRPTWNCEGESRDAARAELVEQAAEGVSAFMAAEGEGAGKRLTGRCSNGDGQDVEAELVPVGRQGSPARQP